MVTNHLYACLAENVLQELSLQISIFFPTSPATAYDFVKQYFIHSRREFENIRPWLCRQKITHSRKDLTTKQVVCRAVVQNKIFKIQGSRP